VNTAFLQFFSANRYIIPQNVLAFYTTSQEGGLLSFSVPDWLNQWGKLCWYWFDWRLYKPCTQSAFASEEKTSDFSKNCIPVTQHIACNI